jgi:hypothetical protein
MGTIYFSERTRVLSNICIHDDKQWRKLSKLLSVLEYAAVHQLQTGISIFLRWTSRQNFWQYLYPYPQNNWKLFELLLALKSNTVNQSNRTENFLLPFHLKGEIVTKFQYFEFIRYRKKKNWKHDLGWTVPYNIPSDDKDRVGYYKDSSTFTFWQNNLKQKHHKQCNMHPSNHQQLLQSQRSPEKWPTCILTINNCYSRKGVQELHVL